MAILRLKFQAKKSIVPTRLSQVELSQFDHSGFVALHVTHDEKAYSFKVPFIRPFKKRPKLSSTINLNAGPLKNLDFEAFQEKHNPNSKAVVKLECRYTLA